MPFPVSRKLSLQFDFLPYCKTMPFLPALSTYELQDFYSTVTRPVVVGTRHDTVSWLQGDLQRYFPHEVLIVAWGDFQRGRVQHEIFSPLQGVPARFANRSAISPLLCRLYARWIKQAVRPFEVEPGEIGLPLIDTGSRPIIDSGSIPAMRSIMVHGVRDKRGGPDCLYVTFGNRESIGESDLSAMAAVMPYVDTALRQFEFLPFHRTGEDGASPNTVYSLGADLDLTEREAEVLSWIAAGKTNQMIGSILKISEFTVKNHVSRLFRKLHVSNRAQAVDRFRELRSHG